MKITIELDEQDFHAILALMSAKALENFLKEKGVEK